MNSKHRPLRLGKAGEGFLERVVYRNLGAARRSVKVGPRMGFDNAVVRIDNWRSLILTTDPVSVIPAIGIRDSAWLSAHLIASDFATSSRAPQYASFNYNFPQQLEMADVEAYLAEMGRECARLGVSIVSGHTGTYPGAGFTVVGGGTMFGFAKNDEILDTSMSMPGDAILVTKGAAIETTAVLSNSAPAFVEEHLGSSLAVRARKYTRLCTTVKDALVASSVGIKEEGVTAMHDATEGGVLGALNEMAFASNHAFVVKKERIAVSKETKLICSSLGIDPLVSLSEGTLLLTCKTQRSKEVLRKLRRSGILASAVGRVADGASGLWLDVEGGRRNRFVPKRDPFWNAYQRIQREHERQRLVS